MNEISNIMRMEAERTGHYGADSETELPPCDICGATNYDFAVKDSLGHIEGCSNCRIIERF